MTDKPTPKNKGGRPKKPPAPPMLGIADRAGDGYKFTVVLGGLVVNGKKYDPQIGANLLAGMLEDGMRRLSPRSPAAPDLAMQDPELANPATNGDGHVSIAERGDAAAEPQDASNGSH